MILLLREAKRNRAIVSRSFSGAGESGAAPKNRTVIFRARAICNKSGRASAASEGSSSASISIVPPATAGRQTTSREDGSPATSTRSRA